MTLSFTGDGADPLVLGDAPFWPVDYLAEPDAWVGHIPFAFWIVAALRPRLLVELGTHSGNSYCAFAQAVDRLGLDTACFAVDTWRGDAHAGHYGEEVFEALSRYHDDRYRAFSRLVRSTFDDAVQHFPDAGVDLLHVDGYHTYEAVAGDFQTWAPKLSPRAVVLFHDINVREKEFGVWRLWEEVRLRHPHFEFLHAHGLGVLGVGSDLPAAVTALWSDTRDASRVARIRGAFARLGGSVVEGMALHRLGQELAARDELIRRGAEERASIETAARAREQAHAAEVAEHRHLISGLQHEIVRLGQLREGLQEQLLRVERERTGASAEAETLRESLQEQLHRVEHDRAEVETLRASLAALHGSTSVRVTRPLRQAGELCRTGLAWVRRGARSR